MFFPDNSSDGIIYVTCWTARWLVPVVKNVTFNWQAPSNSSHLETLPWCHQVGVTNICLLIVSVHLLGCWSRSWGQVAGAPEKRWQVKKGGRCTWTKVVGEPVMVVSWTELSTFVKSPDTNRQLVFALKQNNQTRPDRSARVLYKKKISSLCTGSTSTLNPSTQQASNHDCLIIMSWHHSGDYWCLCVQLPDNNVMTLFRWLLISVCATAWQ